MLCRREAKEQARMLFETAFRTEKSIAVLTLKATFPHLVPFKGIVIA
jgi:hypothetical protein